MIKVIISIYISLQIGSNCSLYTRYSILKLIYKILILVDFAYTTNLKVSRLIKIINKGVVIHRILNTNPLATIIYRKYVSTG